MFNLLFACHSLIISLLIVELFPRIPGNLVWFLGMKNQLNSRKWGTGIPGNLILVLCFVIRVPYFQIMEIFPIIPRKVVWFPGNEKNPQKWGTVLPGNLTLVLCFASRVPYFQISLFGHHWNEFNLSKLRDKVHFLDTVLYREKTKKYFLCRVFSAIF